MKRWGLQPRSTLSVEAVANVEAPSDSTEHSARAATISSQREGECDCTKRVKNVVVSLPNTTQLVMWGIVDLTLFGSWETVIALV